MNGPQTQAYLAKLGKPEPATDYGREAAKKCREIIKCRAERDPFGRDWNENTTEEERVFWLRASLQPARLAHKNWADLPDITRQALRAALLKCATRARGLLQGDAA